VDQLREHGGNAVSEVLSFDNIFKRGKLVDLDAIKGNDQLLVLAEGDLVGGSSCFASLADTFADIEGHTTRCSFHLPTKVTLTMRELGDNLAYLSIQL
jgi:hypothetical protein